MKLWLIYALLSAICAAFVSIFGKVGLTGADTTAATAIRAIIMALFLIGVVLAQGGFSNAADIFSDKRSFLFLALSGIAGACSWLFYFLALKHGKISQVAPVDKLSVVFAVGLAVLIFGEQISAIHLAAITLIATGGLLLAIF